MTALTAAVLLIALSAEPTPYEVGKASYIGGMCSTLGWEGKREAAIAYGDAYAARNPALDPAQMQADVMRGMRDAKAEVDAEIEGFRATGNASKFKNAIWSRCVGVARDIPELLRRTERTQAEFDVAVAAVMDDLI